MNIINDPKSPTGFADEFGNPIDKFGNPIEEKPYNRLEDIKNLGSQIKGFSEDIGKNAGEKALSILPYAAGMATSAILPETLPWWLGSLAVGGTTGLTQYGTDVLKNIGNEKPTSSLPALKEGALAALGEGIAKPASKFVKPLAEKALNSSTAKLLLEKLGGMGNLGENIAQKTTKLLYGTPDIEAYKALKPLKEDINKNININKTINDTIEKTYENILEQTEEGNLFLGHDDFNKLDIIRQKIQNMNPKQFLSHAPDELLQIKSNMSDDMKSALNSLWAEVRSLQENMRNLVVSDKFSVSKYLPQISKGGTFGASDILLKKIGNILSQNKSEIEKEASKLPFINSKENKK